MFAKILTALFVASAVVAAPVETENLDKRITHDGQATYFNVGLGACGWTNVDSDYIVAVNSEQYGLNGYGGNCGQWLTITNTDNGKSVKAYVADECPTCSWGSLDLSPKVFSDLTDGNFDLGVFPISWHYNKKTN
ncbi:hypothetical protein I317_06959 [Kwoniella heveanensis CBS 569]|uniref:Barwin domain-containing protein n=1 Tax=Kwoniella heveanensis BCC8398 TaxID=1296120 RepID=A0A1B9H238_9TREE|nr:hypothetical protein I316_01248 [Kwoniella heveanensis BCC8398]OCF39241.1 hypothetical protein I317_06959 [Kwoniella heveanensis CBS 569]